MAVTLGMRVSSALHRCRARQRRNGVRPEPSLDTVAELGGVFLEALSPVPHHVEAERVEAPVTETLAPGPRREVLALELLRPDAYDLHRVGQPEQPHEFDRD